MDLVRRLYGLPDNYKVLFLGGGATMQFAMVPINLMGPGGSCDMTLTGAWAKKAFADAKKIGGVNLVFDGSDDDFMSLPDPASLKANPGAAYFHLTSNETIGGVPLVYDMSSDFVSRKIPVEKFGLIDAGAQKNAGSAGTSIVIIREDLLERFSAGLIYGAMAANADFYKCPVQESARSNMNIVWRLPSEDLEKQFVAEALEAGMSGLKGHQSVGGCRGSVYNAMPIAMATEPRLGGQHPPRGLLT